MEEKIIRSAIQAHESKKSFHFEFREELKPKQIDNAIRSYAKGVTVAEVIAVLDETMLSNGKKGYLVTEKGIYSSTMFNKKANPLPLDHMVSVEVEESDCIVTYEDGTKRSFFFSIHKEFPEILNTILKGGNQNVSGPEKPAKAVEASKPAAEPKPSKPSKQAEPPKPVEPPKQAEPAKPVEPPKQAEPSKPVEPVAEPLNPLDFPEPFETINGSLESAAMPAEEPVKPVEEKKKYQAAIVGPPQSGKHTLVERLEKSGRLAEEISLLIFETPLELLQYLEKPGNYLNGYVGLIDVTEGMSKSLLDSILIMNERRLPLLGLFFNKRDLIWDDELFEMVAMDTLTIMEENGFEELYESWEIETKLGRVGSAPVYAGSAIDPNVYSIEPEFGTAVQELVLGLNAHEGVLPEGEMEPVSLEELISRYQV